MQQGNFINADVAVRHGNIRTARTTYATAVKTTTHPETQCRKPFAASQYPVAPDDMRMYSEHVKLRIL